MNLNKENDNTIKSTNSFLENSFENFISSAKKLEENYQALKYEVTSLKKELKQKDLEIQRAENLATIGQTASAIAHEIRNPLGAIKLFISILKSDLKENLTVLPTLQQIDICVSTLDNVVSNVLQFSKIKKDILAPINLQSVIKEQLSIIKNTTKKPLEIIENYQCENTFILGSQSSLGRVFYNLFLNAIQAQKENAFIKIDIKQSNKKTLVLISDHGTGIDEKIKEKIFDPFISTKNEGTGLGLSVVKRILSNHNATIKVHNDNGAVFTITFNDEFSLLKENSD